MGVRRVDRLLLWGSQQGSTLLELSVSLLVISLVVTGFFAATTMAQKATNFTEIAGTSSLDISSQLEAVAAQPFKTTYDLAANSPPQVSIQTEVSTLRPGFLQQVKVTALRGEELVQRWETYKANRFQEKGLVPPASGVERVVRINSLDIEAPTGIEGRSGVYQVVSLVNSSLPGDLFVHWQLSKSSTSAKAMIAVFRGTPVGPDLADDATVHPLDVPAPPVALGEVNDADIHTLAVWARDAQPGVYTVYFYNPNQAVDKRLFTDFAEIVCLCAIPKKVP